MREAMKIILAVDGSENSMAVMDEAVRIPWPKGSCLKVLAVAELPTPVLADPIGGISYDYAEWEKALEEQAVANGAKALARYYERGGGPFEVTVKVVKGDPKEIIVEEAADWGADLIMIGTHGYNLLERLWLGSVSRLVTSHANCSVEIVRPRKVQGGSSIKILLAVDGSQCGEEAVKEVAQRPWPAGSEVRVVSAIHLPVTPAPETWALPESYYLQVEKDRSELAEIAISRALSILGESNSNRDIPLTLRGDTIIGHAENVIINVAKEWEADLIMLGSHGYRGWKRLMLGSTSQAVAWHAPCSVQIVRAQEKHREKVS
jgi:nucleotide-binding universal stress UspA family protein